MCTKSEAHAPTQHKTKQIFKAHRGSAPRPSPDHAPSARPRLRPAFRARQRRLTGCSPCGVWRSGEEPCLVSGSWPGCPAPSRSGVLGTAVQMSRLGPCVRRSTMRVALVAGVRGSGKPRGGGPSEHRPLPRASCTLGAGRLAGWVVVSNS